ncbi:transposase [Persicobacter psychrovividus]|uniref:Transposase n=1 Tax=Persicobacter psychrovividus TaxID=387638 RepID=A0ABN6LEN8_9BACT|nr:hypothetical protein PEPS_20970 [Persicobacter psychrovividus]
MKKLEDIHLLNNWLDDNKKYSEEFRALCLKLIDEYDGNISHVAQVTHVSESSLKSWRRAWLEKKRTS